MSKLESLIKAWDMGYFEQGEALRDMPEEELWTRANPRLLSVGELVAHIGYGELQWIGGVEDSPFADDRLQYYPHTLNHPVQLPLSCAQLQEEVERIHAAAKAKVLAADPDYDEPFSGDSERTWGVRVAYMTFHVGYHTGQIYSLRHAMGHETENN